MRSMRKDFTTFAAGLRGNDLRQMRSPCIAGWGTVSLVALSALTKKVHYMFGIGTGVGGILGSIVTTMLSKRAS